MSRFEDESLLPLPRQSQQLNLLVDAKGSSGDDRKSKITSRLLANRAPTPAQKDSMMKQVLPMALIQHYTMLVMRDEVRMIVFAPESAGALQGMTDFDAWKMMETRANLVDLEAAGALHTLNINEVYDALIPKLFSSIPIDINATMTADQLRIIHRVPRESVNMPVYASAHLVNLDITFEQSVLESKERAIRATLANLYCLDLNRILHTQGKQGIAIPRFIYGYPSRAMNEELINHYSGELMLMRRLISEGIETSQITREMLRAKAAEMANEIRA